MPKVYVPNKSSHDFSPAEQFGELVFLTEGLVNRFAVTQLTREIQAALADASADDYVLLTSLPILASLASSILAIRFGRVNFLVFDYKTKRYSATTVVLRQENNDVRAA